jgi:CheY-like chemotaxis protein/nitrogen-specific signal transduction histidine kinase
MVDKLRQRNAEALAALREAETASVSKSQFLANISHEIRTPLHGVVGMIELLQQTELTPLQVHYLRSARQSGETLLTLIEDVLDLSKIEAGKVELEHAPFRAQDVVQDTLLMFSDQAASKGLKLSTAFSERSNLLLLGDPHRLSRILINLVGNALKFTAEGSVAIRVSFKHQEPELAWLQCEVADTGIGIPPERQQEIFEAFSQADASTTRRYGGTGLGLSICRQLCQLMGGEIGVRSQVGAGSTFWFNIPFEVAPGQQLPATRNTSYSEGAAGQAGEPSASIGQQFQEKIRQLGLENVHILLVEDNPIGVRVTQALLDSLGCHTIVAKSGTEAVAAYRDIRFDAVLMDCHMPEMDGYEATRAIRQIDAVRGWMTPVIALTANAVTGSREACLSVGMDDHIAKPVTSGELSAKLLQWLAVPRGLGMDGERPEHGTASMRHSGAENSLPGE